MENINRGGESLSEELVSQQPRYIISWLCIIFNMLRCTYIGQNDYKLYTCTFSNFIELCTPYPSYMYITIT